MRTMMGLAHMLVLVVTLVCVDRFSSASEGASVTMAMTVDACAVEAAAQQHPLYPGVRFSYGTAGFRTVGERLEGVAFRMGMLMVLRSAAMGRATGVMVSASHNPGQDNGMKLVDASGAMLTAEWEPVAESLANAGAGDVAGVLGSIISDENIAMPVSRPRVFIARDTRATGPALVAALEAGVKVVGGEAVDFGVATTPQLHYYVYSQDTSPDEQSYIANAVRSLETLRTGAPKTHITIDCSNGVGYPKMQALAAAVAHQFAIKLLNGDVGNHTALNARCGADFIQKEKTAPLGIEASAFAENDHVAAFDGDADRLVYFFFKDGEFSLLDGDRIAVLYATYIKKLVDDLGDKVAQPRMGIVQTAYANGASTAFMRDVLKVEVAMTPTGVKHLHHKAVEYDVGVYFEANGHGTVVMSDSFRAALAKVSHPAAERLLAVSSLASPVCGDALLDMLLCECALSHMGWSIQSWASMYADAPSRMTKVTVPDPQRIKTTWDQTRTTAPDGLQAGIDEAVAGFPHGSRSFVRPSGTEPIVRVYAESDTQANSDALATRVEDVVRQHLK